MKEIPIPYIKANQTGIVLFVILAFLFTQPLFLAALWLIQVIGLLSGGKLNLFVRIAKPWLTIEGKETQAQELQRFNNVLAVLFLTLALFFSFIGWSIPYYVFALMLFCAAGAALLGYCIGCTIYYQYKQMKARRLLPRR